LAQNHHRFLFAELFQICAGEAQGQAIEKMHDETDHDRVPAQAQFDEIGDTQRVGDRFGNSIKLTVPNLNVDIGVGDNVLEPICVPSARRGDVVIPSTSSY